MSKDPIIDPPKKKLHKLEDHIGVAQIAATLVEHAMIRSEVYVDAILPLYVGIYEKLLEHGTHNVPVMPCSVCTRLLYEGDQAADRVTQVTETILQDRLLGDPIDLSKLPEYEHISRRVVACVSCAARDDNLWASGLITKDKGVWYPQQQKKKKLEEEDQE